MNIYAKWWKDLKNWIIGLVKDEDKEKQNNALRKENVARGVWVERIRTSKGSKISWDDPT